MIQKPRFATVMFFRMVELRRFERPTPSVRGKCSPAELQPHPRYCGVLRAAPSCDKFGRVKLPDTVRREAMVKQL